MADVNAPSGQTPTMAPPVRADDQILPHIRWISIGKSNCYLDLKNTKQPNLQDRGGSPEEPQLLQGKKRATLIVIPSIRFTKMIIHHLQRRHRFHPRPDSSLHLSNKEPVLGYLKFSAKGTKSEVFGMPIPNSLITTEIQQATYYQEYLEKTTQPGKKPKAPARPSISIPVASTQPAPTSAPAKSQENKRKQATETTDKLAKAKRIKHSFFLVIRELESGKYQPLPEVPGKGKAKVTEEQVSHDLLSLQKHKETSPADQYIFQRRVFEPTGSSGHDESPYALLGQSNNEEESEKVVLRAKEGGQDEDQAGPDPDAQAEDQTGSDAGAQANGQARSNPDETSEGQAGSNPDKTSKGQAGPDPGDAEAKAQSISSPVVSIAVSEVVTDAVDWAMQAPLRNRFRDLPEADMKEILHQHMWESDSYKSHEDHMQLFEALGKSINLDHFKELTQDLAEARKKKKKKKSRESPKTPPGSPSHQLPPPPPPAGPSGALGAPRASGSTQMPPSPPAPSSTNQEIPSKGSATPSPSKTAASAEYQAWMTTDIRLRPSISLTPADLEMDEDMAPDEQAQLLDDEDIGSAHIPIVNLRQGWWKPFEEERPTTPKPAWSIRSSDVPVAANNWASALASNYSPPPEDSLLAQTDDIATFIDWFCKRRGITELKPHDLKGPAYEIVKFFHPDVIHLQYQMEESHKLLTNSVDDPILRHNVSKPLPLGGPLGQVTIQSDFFFNKDLEYLRYNSKGRRPALSISKLKAAYYPDAGLEQMVPDQFWIEEEYKYDIAAMYGISHWWFQRQRFYIDRHTSEEDFQLGIESYQTQDKYGVQMMMRFNEIHKFNDGTLLQIDEALDYRVKEFRINKLNPCLNTRFWTRKDVDRCNAFMFAIQRGLRTRRIFRNLESFVGGGVKEGDYRLLRRTD
nr:hypothetical protein [Tanacetum cinerariifolium]